MKRYRELIGSVLGGGREPICPTALWQHHPVADQEADSLCDATLRFQQRFDGDFVKITPASTFQLRDHGLTDAWRGDELGRRWIGPGLIRGADDWRRLGELDPAAGFLGRHLACAAMVRRALDPEIPVVQTVFLPLFQAAALGGERFLRDCAEHPDEVAAGLEVLSRNTVKLIEALVDAGVDGIFLVAQHARAGIFAEQRYEALAGDSDRACVAAAAALPLNFFHLHGESVHLGAVPDDGGVVLHYEEGGANPPVGTVLRAGRRMVSSGPCQHGWIRTGTPEQVRQETKELLRRCKGPRFLLSAGCVLTQDTPAANVEALIAEARLPRPDRDDESREPAAPGGGHA
jgi:uroporphyrinogen decarboxylase